MRHNEIYDTMFNMALAVEKTSNAKMVSGIFRRTKLISFGVNSKKSHPFQKRFGSIEECIYLHSEICAIKNALRVISLDDLKRCSIYVSRVKKDKPRGKYVSGLAKPCAGCMNAIAAFEIKSVFYTEDDKRGFTCQ